MINTPTEIIYPRLNGMNPLLLANQPGHHQMVEFLIRQSAEDNFQIIYRNTDMQPKIGPFNVQSTHDTSVDQGAEQENAEEWVLYPKRDFTSS